jgi:hypothetical protein
VPERPGDTVDDRADEDLLGVVDLDAVRANRRVLLLRSPVRCVLMSL